MPPSMLVQYPRTYFLNARGVLRGALGEGGNPVLFVHPSCLEMQKAPGCPGAFVLLCFYSLCSRETMQLGQLEARR
jgi:hypothetical protein